MNTSRPSSLAQKCYDSTQAEIELFDVVNEILGCSTGDCTADGFVWGACDTYWDEYDGSVEVVRPVDANWMTRDQANALLDLGFGVVFESIGDKAQRWTRADVSACSSREGNEVRRLRAEISALRKKL